MNNLGQVSRKVANATAYKEYERFRVIQDREHLSDFDEFAMEVKNIDKLE